MKLEQIFNKISEKEGHTFVVNQEYIPKTDFEIQTPTGYAKVISMIIKEDDILKISFNDGTDISIGKGHMIKKDGCLSFGGDLKIGDVIYNLNGNKVITDITTLGKQKVYDCCVDTKDHLYIDNDGFIHHNTYTITKKIKEMIGPEGDKWVHIKGKLSPLGMYQAIFLNREKLIVFDDADSVFANQDTVNMLKAALDSYEERVISWISPTTVDVSRMSSEDLLAFYTEIEEMLRTDPSGKIKFPNKFEFTGRIIFISNLPESKIDSAIKSRSFVIDITLNASDVFKRMESILEHIGGDAPIEEKKEVLDYLKDNVAGMDGKEVNMRTFILAMRIKQSGTSRWKDMVIRYT